MPFVGLGVARVPGAVPVSTEGWSSAGEGSSSKASGEQCG